MRKRNFADALSTGMTGAAAGGTIGAATGAAPGALIGAGIGFVGGAAAGFLGSDADEESIKRDAQMGKISLEMAQEQLAEIKRRKAEDKKNNQTKSRLGEMLGRGFAATNSDRSIGTAFSSGLN